MTRRGQLSPFVLGLVIALAGFIILTVAIAPKLFSRNNLPDREACHLSVLARASVPSFSPSIGPTRDDIVPLKCTTNKICITGTRDGACSPQLDGEPYVRRAVVDVSDVEATQRTISEELANAMLDCWTMMGEGKLDIVARPGAFDKTSTSCLICTRVALDARTIPDPLLQGIDLNRYLAETTIPGSSQTYLQRFLGRDTISYQGQDQSGTMIDLAAQKKEITTKDIAIIFSQIRTNDETEAAAQIALGGIALAGGGLITSTGRAVAKRFWPAALGYLAVAGVSSLVAYETALEGQSIALGYCGEVTSNDEEARAGCSLVRPIHFDDDAINAFCTGKLEGNL